MKTGILSVILSIFCLSFSPPKLTWVAIGDSITYLNDHPNETGDRITAGYMSRVVAKRPDIQYVNKGFNGWTVVQIANRWEKLQIPQADIYTVFLGTNDWWSGNALGSIDDYKNATGTKTVLGAYRQITDQLKVLNPNAKIIIISPMKRVDFVYLKAFGNNAHGCYLPRKGQELKDFVKAFEQIAQLENYAFVDLYNNRKLDYKHLVKYKLVKDSLGVMHRLKYPDFQKIPFKPKTDLYPYPVEAIHMTYDGLHPSDAGYQEIAKELLKKL